MEVVERLHEYLETSRKSLSSSEVTSLVDVSLELLKDANFRVSQGALQALTSDAVISGKPLKLHFNALVPAVIDRLSDAKQPVEMLPAGCCSLHSDGVSACISGAGVRSWYQSHRIVNSGSICVDQIKMYRKNYTEVSKSRSRAEIIPWKDAENQSHSKKKIVYHGKSY